MKRQHNFRLDEHSARDLEIIRVSRGVAGHSDAVRLALRNEARRAGFTPRERARIINALHNDGLDDDLIRRVTLAIE